MRVGLNDKWDNQKLENKRIISSYEIYNSESGLPFRPIAQLQEIGVELSKLTEPNPTTNALKKQEPYKMVFIPLVQKTLSLGRKM
ncbi:DUF3519 domain-containing protein [Helicobacter pylori]|uniref:DUF3519 domain-containing protein n=1 Tax=Helicobacter pylori TaxID=210 RepID=UPI003D21E65C